MGMYKGLSTIEGGRGHVTITIQMLKLDILKIVCKAYTRVLYHAACVHGAVVNCLGACGNLDPVL